MFYLIAFVIGIVAGLRALTPVAAVSWAARLGRLHLDNSPLAFLGYAATPYIFTILALAEIVNDKLPKTPSRKAPAPFATRVITGAFSGAAVGASYHSLLVGLVLGGIGAVVGTLGGAEIRGQLARAFGRDLPAALLEDAVAIIVSVLLMAQLP